MISTCEISTKELSAEFPVLKEDKYIVDDAIDRWVKKVGGSSNGEMKHRIPIVLHLEGRRCVVLHLRAYSLGGSPVYCYSIDDNRLISSQDNVE